MKFNVEVVPATEGLAFHRQSRARGLTGAGLSPKKFYSPGKGHNLREKISFFVVFSYSLFRMRPGKIKIFFFLSGNRQTF